MADQPKKPRRRRAPKLHFGEYVPADPENSEAVHRARAILMGEVRRAVPEFFEELSVTVFPQYEEFARSGFRMAFIWGRSPYDFLPDSKLKQALSTWAAHFHAEAPWLMTGALRTLESWHRNPERRERFYWEAAYVISGPVGLIVPAPRLNDYDPSIPWSVWRADVDRKLDEYGEEIAKMAKAHGFKRVPRMYSIENLHWFALYQFAGLSPTQIADKLAGENPNPPEPSDILKGIKIAQKLIAWDRLRD